MTNKEIPLRRNSLDAQASQAESLLRNPIFKQAFDTKYADIISLIETTTLDSTRESELKCLELVRQLQVLVDIKRTIMRPINSQQIANKT